MAFRRFYRVTIKRGCTGESLIYFIRFKFHSSKEKVKILVKEKVQQATIIGLDTSGFLCAMDDAGSIHTLTPDGNSFNILSGLISAKK